MNVPRKILKNGANLLEFVLHQRLSATWGQHHPIDDVDDAVAGTHILRDHLLQISGGTDQHHSIWPLVHLEFATLHSGDLLAGRQRGGGHRTVKHMVEQDRSQLCLVLWLQQGVQCAAEGSEGCIHGCEDCEGALGAQDASQVCSNDSGHQSAQVTRALGQLHDVLRTCSLLHKCRLSTTRGQHHPVDDVDDPVAGAHILRDHLLQVPGGADQHHSIRPLVHLEFATLHSGDLLAGRQCGGGHRSVKHMVKQDRSQLSLVLWLQQGVQCAAKGSEGCIHGSKDCEGPLGAQDAGQICSHHSGHQGAQVTHALGQLDDVLRTCSLLHKFRLGTARGQHHPVDDVDDPIAGTHILLDHLLQVPGGTDQHHSIGPLVHLEFATL